MNEIAPMQVIARIRTDFPQKFGIPRQSGLVDALKSTVIFEPPYRNPDALRGLEGFSHLWLIWQFSAHVNAAWSPTVRPPRLGGNVRMGVFATRSPFRPNPIGLSAVRLESVEQHPEFGCILHLSGADLMDGTPILDIKPYIPYADSHPNAKGGFAQLPKEPTLHVILSEELRTQIPEIQQEALLGVLAQDPRPQYQEDPTRIYGLRFAQLEVKFTVSGQNLTVCSIHSADV